MTQITLPHNHGESADELFSLLPAPQEFQTSAELFGLLSDESRLRIFWILCHYEECVINLSSLVGMSSPAVSHHLRQCKKGRTPSFLREYILPDVSYFLLILSSNLLIGFQYLMHYIIHLLQSLYLPGLQKRQSNCLPTIFSSLCFVPALIP